MRRHGLLSFFMISALIVSISGCGASNGAGPAGTESGAAEADAGGAAGTESSDIRGSILPTRIENIMDEDVIPEGAEAAWEGIYDVTAFNPRMFVGTWKRIRTEGEEGVLEVPAPRGSDTDTLSINAFPTNMIFDRTVRNDGPEVFRFQIDDYAYLQAEYEPAQDASEEPDAAPKEENMPEDMSNLAETESGAGEDEHAVQEAAESCEFRMIYAVAGQLLAFGFTGETTDEEYYEEDVDAIDIKELDYEFSWTGYELTLSYGEASATYVPSTFNGDMLSACDGFSGGCGQTRIPGWQMSPLKLKGDGSGMVGTYYDYDIPMHYSFNEDGSFSVAMENGEEIRSDTYWYSDSCLTLGAGDNKIMYQHDLLVIYDGDDNYVFNVDSNIFETADELNLAGKDLPTPLLVQVKKLVDKGFRTDVDLDKTVIPSGFVSPEFKISFRTAELTVRAFNPTDLDLPLEAALVCGYRISDEAGKASRRLGFLIHSNYVTCGETTREELLSYGNIFPVSEDLLEAEVDNSIYLYSSDFIDYGANLLEDYTNIDSPLILRFEMNGDTLQAIDCSYSAIEDDNLYFNVKNENTLGLSREDIEATCALRDELAGQIKDGFSSFSGTACDEFGAVYMPWNKLFPYGKAELSEEGKAFLGELYETYAGVTDGDIRPANIEIGAYARIDLKENGESFTVPRAKAVFEELSTIAGEDADRLSFRGYMESDYLKALEMLGYSDNMVCIRFFLDPVKSEDGGREFEFVYKKADDQEVHRFLDLSENLVGRKRAEYAAKYKGSYDGDVYVNEAIGMEWKLPDGWHFYEDDELLSYNGATAESLLLSDEPIYIFAGVNEDYDTMLDVRLYPCEGDAYEEAREDIAENLYRSYESVLRASCGDAGAEEETVTLGGRKVKKGTFRFTAEDVEYVRKQYYLVFEDAAAVITYSGTEESSIMDSPGIN